MPASGSPGKREANGVAHGRADVGDRLARGLGRDEHDGVAGRVDDDELRSGEERDSHPSHTRLEA